PMKVEVNMLQPCPAGRLHPARDRRIGEWSVNLDAGQRDLAEPRKVKGVTLDYLEHAVGKSALIAVMRGEATRAGRADAVFRPFRYVEQVHQLGGYPVVFAGEEVGAGVPGQLGIVGPGNAAETRCGQLFLGEGLEILGTHDDPATLAHL